MPEKTRAYPKQIQIKPTKRVSLPASARQDAQGVLVLILVLVLCGENIDTTRFKQTENNSLIYPPLLFLTFAFYVGAATSPKRGNTPAGQQTTHNSSVRYDEAQITSRGVGFFLMII